MSDPEQCPRCGVWSPIHAPGDAVCVAYQYAAAIAAQVRRREAAESSLASSRAEAERLEREMFQARDIAAEHVAAESKERRRAEEAEAEAERLRARMVGCVDCGGTFALADLDDDGLCSECRAARDAPTPTPEAERHAAIERWSCPEPGCCMLGAHDGPHRAAVGLDDIGTIEWSEPGAYLAALRPLAARAALGKEG